MWVEFYHTSIDKSLGWSKRCIGFGDFEVIFKVIVPSVLSTD